MADREMSAGVLAELERDRNEPVHLFAAELDSGTFYFTDSYRSIVWDGITYQATGELIGFDGIRETADAQVTTVTGRLSGVTQLQLAAFLTDDYIGRSLRIYKAMLNSDGTAMEPTLIFDGRMHGWATEENPKPNEGTCTIAIAATSHFGDFERKPGRRTNTNVQEIHFAGDKFFDFCSQIPAQRQSVWGRANP